MSVTAGKTRTYILWIAVSIATAIIVFFAGYFVKGCTHEHDWTPVADKDTGKILFWTCSMHPEINRPGPGACPKCGMNLIPVRKSDEEELGPRELKLSEKAMKLAQVETAKVERKFVEAEIRMVGKIDFDETRLAHITAWVPGRLDRLYVDYTGIPVRKGDHLVHLYSPELLTAQAELLQALKTANELGGNASESLVEETKKTLDAVRKKLRLWGLTKEQIAEIEKRGVPSDHLTIYSPMGGIVIHKHAVEGMYVKTGMRIYTIADLSQVWAKLDAYESDLIWLRYGQEVEFKTKAYPGQIFKGKISFIDPVLDPKTRTVKVRVNVPNTHGKLKPQMFVSATVRAKVAAGGKVMDPDLAGKWICPMHPEIVGDKPGDCPVCGMPLARAESLGYVAVDTEKRETPLVIPASAPLITGERAVVYVVVPGKVGVFEGREIVLGPRAGEHYIVKKGLREGEAVVTKGNFKIDSEIQIKAKPSMMNPEGGGPAPGHHHGGTPKKTLGPGRRNKTEDKKPHPAPAEFRNQLDAVFAAYFEIWQALSKDSFDAAKTGAKKIAIALESVDMALLKGEAHMAWMKELEALKKSGGAIAGSGNIKKAREHFHVLSETMYAVAKKFGTSGSQTVLRFHCLMAFDNRGAHWLQNRHGVENPYFGSAMFKCGELVETISPGRDEKDSKDHKHE